jgi:hypothetical protein
LIGLQRSAAVEKTQRALDFPAQQAGVKTHLDSRSNNDQTSRQANKEVVAATLRCTENSSSIKAFKI